MRLLLTVYPAIAQGLVEGFGVGDGFFARILFEDAKPDAIRVSMIYFQPTLEFRRGFESQGFQAMSYGDLSWIDWPISSEEH